MGMTKARDSGDSGGIGIHYPLNNWLHLVDSQTMAYSVWLYKLWLIVNATLFDTRDI